MSKNVTNDVSKDSPIGTSRAAVNSKCKLKKNVLTSLKWACEITVISDYPRTCTFCARRSFIQNWSVIFQNNVLALQLVDCLLQYTNQNCEEHKNYEILMLVWIMSVFQSFNVIVWPRPFLQWPNLKGPVRHMTHFD